MQDNKKNTNESLSGNGHPLVGLKIVLYRLINSETLHNFVDIVHQNDTLQKFPLPKTWQAFGSGDA